MIRRLRLQNFRRHSDTELVFEPDHQIVLVSGRNGAGKSTVFEALLFALYGEGRNGRANLDRLVRRGGEIEGMEVEVEFELEGVSYRVVRRRDNKTTTALLFANDIPLMEGSREVTAEVSRILGVDSQGFRVATYAQQRELNGLAAMRPAERASVLGRILQLDVISKAKEEARAQLRDAKASVAAYSRLADRSEVEAEIKRLEKELEASKAELESSRAALAEIDARIGRLADAVPRYREAEKRLAAAEASHEEARRVVERLREALSRASVEPPDPRIEEFGGIGEVIRRRDEALGRREALIIRIERAKQGKAMLAQAAELRDELASLETEISEVEGVLRGLPDRSDPGRVRVLLEQGGDRVLGIRRRLDETARLAVLASGRLEDLRRLVSECEELGAECPTCGQAIPDKHRRRRARELKARLAEAQDEHARLEADRRALEDELAEAERSLAGLREELAEAERAEALRGELERRKAQLVRARDSYLSRLASIPDENDVEDVDSLYAELGEVEALAQVAGRLADKERERLLRQQRRLELEAQLAEAVARAEQSRKLVEEAAIPDGLAEQNRLYEQLVEARKGEADLVAALETQVAVVEEKLANSRRRLADLRAAVKARRQAEDLAQVAAWSVRVLEDLEAERASQIRPTLQGAVSDLLSRLSNGRFTSVELDEDYNVFVLDDGVMRPLGDLSGGESDLVALAIRLGLTSILAGRVGAPSIGMLILDECFGSQDHERRESILTALRALRSMYGQIFLISHVGGLEDAADLVVELDWDPESDELDVLVSG